MIVWVWVLTITLGLITAFAWWMGRTVYTRMPWNVRFDTAPALDEATLIGSPITLRLMGELPRKMYINDSGTITLQGSAIRQPDVDFDLPRGVEVQIELLAAAFSVDGDKRQQKHIPEVGSNVSFRWGIAPQKSGMQELALVASRLGDNGRVYEIGVKMHKVKVTEFAGLTAGQLRLFSMVGTTLTLLVSVAGVLVGCLGLLFH
jgi:hypothetical protein